MGLLPMKVPRVVEDMLAKGVRMEKVPRLRKAHKLRFASLAAGRYQEHKLLPSHAPANNR